MIINIFTGPLNYDIDMLYKETKEEVNICVDQGCKIALASKIRIHKAIGDFDSLDIDIYEELKREVNDIIELNSIKDYTDTYTAVKEALKLNPDQIVIYGALGNRIDHSIANIMLLKLGNITILNNTTRMKMLNPGKYEINNEYQYISFFAEEDVFNLNLKGFKYELNNITLTEENPLCISNEGSGTISFDEGVLLVIQNND